MKLSIIIPVYNVELYVRKCIESCINQDISSDEYEIIAINDGSSDRSAQIIEKLSRNYENVKIIHQSNQGLSKTRNNGLLFAKGQFVWFIDSDDWIEPNCLKNLIENMKDEPDILHIQYRYAYENKTFKYAPIVSWNGVINGSELTKAGGLPEPAQFTLYRRQFLIDNNLFFSPGIYHEDCDFKYRCVWKAHKCKALPQYLYNYLQRTDGSISKNFKLKNGIDYLTVINRMIEFIKENHIENPNKAALYFKVAVYLNMIYKGCSNIRTTDQKIIIDLITENRGILKSILQSNSIKYKLEALLISVNPKLFSKAIIRIYQILQRTRN